MTFSWVRMLLSASRSCLVCSRFSSASSRRRMAGLKSALALIERAKHPSISEVVAQESRSGIVIGASDDGCFVCLFLNKGICRFQKAQVLPLRKNTCAISRGCRAERPYTKCKRWLPPSCSEGLARQILAQSEPVTLPGVSLFDALPHEQSDWDAQRCRPGELGFPSAGERPAGLQDACPPMMIPVAPQLRLILPAAMLQAHVP